MRLPLQATVRLQASVRRWVAPSPTAVPPLDNKKGNSDLFGGPPRDCNGALMQKGSTREHLKGGHAWAPLLEPLKNGPNSAP
jgi:hypothetical protein